MARIPPEVVVDYRGPSWFQSIAERLEISLFDRVTGISLVSQDWEAVDLSKFKHLKEVRLTSPSKLEDVNDEVRIRERVGQMADVSICQVTTEDPPDGRAFINRDFVCCE